MRILVVGCGSIGLRHMRNLRALGINDLLGFDTAAGARERAQKDCGARLFDSLDEALNLNPTLALICTPPHLHVSAALQAAAAGCHLFIEKPLANHMEGLDLLAGEVRRRRLITLVGCNMRFHHGPASIKRLLAQGVVGNVISAILDAGQYMPDWHPELDYRNRYSASNEMGGGVVLDGIHEIDYARWLFGEISEVFAYGGKRSTLDIDVEDVADILMKFESGASAMIHIDYIQRAYSRSCKVIGEQGTIVWDINQDLRWYSAAIGQWTTIEAPHGYNINQMYLDEMAHLLECVRQQKPTTLEIEEAICVTRWALRIKKSMSTGEKQVRGVERCAYSQ